MPYLGNEAADRFVSQPAVDQFSGDGSTTAFTLSFPVTSDQDILVSVDGVVQDVAAYAVSSGTTLTFTAAPSSNSGNNIFVNYLARTHATVAHPATSALAATTGTFSDNVTINGNLSVSGTGAGAAGVVSASSSGTAISIDSSNRVTLPSQPAFSVGIASSQTNLPVGSTTDIVFGTEIFDVGANFASNTFTAPITGKYQLSYMMYTQTVDSAATYVYFQITTSNRGYWVLMDPPRDHATSPAYDLAYWTFTLSILADMDANDTAKVQFNQSGGAAQQDVLDGTTFTGVLVC